MSLRISTPGKGGQGRRGGSGEAGDSDFYMSRLIKLLPAEAVAVYPLMQRNAEGVISDVKSSIKTANDKIQTAVTEVDPETIAQAAQEVPDWLPVAMAWFVLMLVILLRWQATRDANGNAQWGAVVIAAISFFLWVPTMNGTFGVLEFATAAEWIRWPDAVEEFVPEVLLIFWTIVIPAFYKPQN